MTHTATYLAVGLTVIVLASSYGTAVPATKDSWSEELRQTTHRSTSASPVGQTTSTAENVTTDVATESSELRSISAGERIVDTIDDGETKRYVFTAQAGRTIRVIHNDIVNPANLTLYDPDGEVVARDTTHSKYRHPFGATAEQNGTYTLEVRSESNTTYQFQVETRNPDYIAPYENATNDDQESALMVSENEDEIDLTGVLAEGEEDWYAVTLDEGERLNVTVSHKLAGTQDGAFAFDLGNGMQVDILDADGRDVGEHGFLTKSTGSDWSEYHEARQTALADATGTYYIRITNSSYMGGFAEYEMTIEVNETETPTTSIRPLPPTPLTAKSPVAVD